MSELSLRHVYSGKVRDLYEVDDRHLLMVASDRLSAFDVVMSELIPGKGRVLTALTDYWVTEFAGTVPTALVSCDPAVIERFVPGFSAATEWHGRTMLVRRAQMLPLECIVRGRLAGQAYDEYVLSATVHHMAVPAGLALTDPFPAPMFTPSTKAAAALIVGDELLAQAEELCLDLFTRASRAMALVGLVLADTKFELGVVDGQLVICDEVLTPDSSRIWQADQVCSGQTPPSFDKQPFRDWLASQRWDHTPPPPAVPAEIVAATSARYLAAYERVTGRSLADWYGA
jgi:phosphoribosylaminoimidazole-succinocarboxamide synthase